MRAAVLDAIGDPLNVQDVTIVESREGMVERAGGSWRDNRYPGLACDVCSQSTRSTTSMRSVV